MKVNEVINESVVAVAAIKLDFNDLTSLQIGTLRALNDGRVDFDRATDSMMDLIDELQGFNLVDDAFSLTPTGEKALGLANSIGGSERRAAALKAQKQQSYDPDSDDHNDFNNQFDDDDWSDNTGVTFGTISQQA